MKPLHRAVASIARVCLCILPIGLTSCGILTSSDCVTVGVSGVSAYVTDAVTKGLPSSTPSLRLVDGNYEEQIAAPTSFPGQQPVFLAAAERPGTYRLTISAVGYRDYVRENIVVRRESGGCRYLKPVRVDAALTKAP